MIPGLRVGGVCVCCVRAPVALSASAFTLCCAALGWCGVLPAASSEPVFLLDQDYYDRHQSRPFAVVSASPRCVLSIHARAQLRSVRAEHHASLRLCEGIVVEASIVCSSLIEQK